MALLPKYEFDIFISYRHNDNRSGWVTEFVNALQEELAATVKEPLSIYFDKNPHDGLLETHNVDKSLEGKLKCLFFIPIISQTYCDTKSFAWKQEFRVFNQLAKEDELGRDIRLSNGNVASRILPVKIHDLDATDKATIESELGGALRAIEFIYKEPGVNRPLKPTDSKSDNQNRTDYRNQVNKVANAVKELVVAAQKPAPPIASTQMSSSAIEKKVGPRWLLTILVIVLFFLAAYLTQKWFASETPAQSPASIVVLPFVNMSSNEEQEYFCDGLSEEIINTLVQESNLKVISRTSAFFFKGKNHDVREIGKQLGVQYALEGSIRFDGIETLITTQLINTLDGTHLWSKSFKRRKENAFEIQEEIARLVAMQLKSTFRIGPVGEKKVWDKKAFDLYLQGLYYQNRGSIADQDKAEALYRESLKIDSSHIIVYSHLYSLLGAEPESKERQTLFVHVNQIDSANIYSRILSGMHMAEQLNFKEAARQTRIVETTTVYSSDARAIRLTARLQWYLGYHDRAIQFAKKAIELDPLQNWGYLMLADAQFAGGNFEAAAEAYEKLIGSTGNKNWTFNLATAYVYGGRLDKVKRLLEEEESKELRSNITDFITITTGPSTESAHLYKEMIKNVDNPPIVKAIWATLYQKYDDAFRFLNEAVKNRDASLSGFLTSGFFIPIRRDYRYNRLLVELGYPEVLNK